MLEKIIRYEIKGAFAKVYEVFAYLDQYAAVHPLIIEAKAVDGNRKEYVIKETPYPWFPIKIHYRAKVKRKKEKIIYKITGLPFTQGKIIYQFELTQEHSTKISFHLQLNSKLPGKKYCSIK